MKSRSRPPVDWTHQPLRSVLFAPGSEPRKIARLGSSGADAVVLDLEDAVAEDAKEAARATTSAGVKGIDAGPVVGVRLNGAPVERLIGDAQSVVQPNLDCLVVPKVESVDQVMLVSDLLSDLEATEGMTPGSIRLLILIETAAGITNVERILEARTPGRIEAIFFGAVDLASDLGLPISENLDALQYGRSRVVMAGKGSGITHVLDGPWMSIGDEVGFAADNRRSRRMGFTGRGVIHPNQVEPANRGYAELSASEVALYSSIVAEFREALTVGRASVSVSGQFVDYPVYKNVMAHLARHQAVTGDVPPVAGL